MQWLAGDIGGTKTWLALYEERSGILHEARSARYPSAEHEGLEPIIRTFLDQEPVAGACFGIAGPVIGRRVEVTNLPWVVEAAALEALLGLARVPLINDFTAVAWGIDALDPDHVDTLQAGELDRGAPRAVLGAGTGLGEAIMVPAQPSPIVLSTEGGHTDFAARDPFEDALLRELRARHGRASVERVVSGPGLVAIYEHICAHGHARTSVEAEVAARGAEAIGDAPHDPAATLAVERFAAALGAEAGNFALKVVPFGGLFVAGGIAPKLRSVFPRFDSIFLEAFLDKGRMRTLLQRVPIRIVLDPKVGLLGAAQLAQRASR